MKQPRVPIKPVFHKVTSEGIDMYFCFNCDKYVDSDQFYHSCIVRQIRRCKTCCKRVNKCNTAKQPTKSNPFNAALNKLRNDCRGMANANENEWKIDINVQTSRWLLEWWNENTDFQFVADNIAWVLWRPHPMMYEKNGTVVVKLNDIVPFDKPTAKKLRRIPIELRRQAVSSEVAECIDQSLDQLTRRIDADSKQT